MSAKITGEAVFVLNGVAMNYATSFDSDLHLRELRSLKPPKQSGLSGGYTTRDAPRRRTIEWQVAPNILTNKIQITGRASADNRWPLGFQIEPFSFQTVKVGQKLKFKQFPVALPQAAKP